MEDESILLTIKKLLHIPEDYNDFDHDILVHTNSAIATLHQLGVGPSEGYVVQDEENKWSEFQVQGITLQNVRTYIYLRVRLVFDPPTNAFLVSSMEKQVQELDFRLMAAAAEGIQDGK